MRGYKKFKNVPTTIDGIKFQSKGEADRYLELKLMERAGYISELSLQPKFPLVVNGNPVKIRSGSYPNGRAVSYYADFRYKDCNGVDIVEDFKGMDLPISRLKRALVESIYGIQVLVTKKASRRTRCL